jgi:hypothetical protein
LDRPLASPFSETKNWRKIWLSRFTVKPGAAPGGGSMRVQWQNPVGLSRTIVGI